MKILTRKQNFVQYKYFLRYKFLNQKISIILKINFRIWTKISDFVQRILEISRYPRPRVIRLSQVQQNFDHASGYQY